MPFSLIPDRLFDAYDQITPELLRGYGVTLLLSDLDFTLAEKKTRRPPQMLRDWLDRMEAGGITVDLARQAVFAGKREVALTPKEFALLRCLMQNKNMVMSREQLLIKCWGYDYEGESRAVDTHIKRLREKLGEHAACIKTVIKAGYRLEG